VRGAIAGFNDNQTERLMYELYGLTEEEARILEGTS